jgi:hypothetical protein
MKLVLLFALLLTIGITNSATLTTDNDIGGKTTLTDKQCKFNSIFKEATSTNSVGEIAYACYWVQDEYVYFITKDHIIRRLPRKKFI